MSRASAVMSECGTYRYSLTRGEGPRVVFVMLNPSTADAEQDDPTIRRCAGFARRWNYRGIHVVNLYALRATNPRELRTHAAPIGPENDYALTAACLGTAGPVVCAWGIHGARERVNAVRLLLASLRKQLYCIGLTKSGAPRHPLYAPYGEPLPWPGARCTRAADRGAR